MSRAACRMANIMSLVVGLSLWEVFSTCDRKESDPLVVTTLPLEDGNVPSARYRKEEGLEVPLGGLVHLL